MIALFGELWSNRHLRLACLNLVLIGTIFSSIGPFQSLIAIEVLGVPDALYAGVLVVEALVGVASAVLIGIVTDSSIDRRTVAIAGLVPGLAGMALMWLAPSIPAFVLAHAVLLPLGATVFGQTFALTRLATEGMEPDRRDAVLSAVRAFLALPFVVVLPVWSLVFAAEVPLTVVYPVALIVYLGLLAAVVAMWPSDRTAGWSTAKSALSVLQGLGELVQPAVLVRVAAIGAIISGQPIHMAVTGLAFEQAAGRGADDTALFFALVALLEIPVMLGMASLLRLYRRRTLIAIGAVLYGSFLLLLPVMLTSPLVWLLVIPTALGGGLLLSLPIAYMQDLLAARPGAGGSLLAVQRVISQGIAAVVFAVGTIFGGYGLVAVLSGTGMILAVGWFLWLEREGPRRI